MGRWPPWLAPVQVAILPVTDRHLPFARGFADELHASAFRYEISGSEETLPKRVRAAELARVPYVAVVGDREVADNSVSVRVRGTKQARTMSRPEFRSLLTEKVRKNKDTVIVCPSCKVTDAMATDGEGLPNQAEGGRTS